MGGQDLASEVALFQGAQFVSALVAGGVLDQDQALVVLEGLSEAFPNAVVGRLFVRVGVDNPQVLSVH
ncbi:hypothetical protein BSR28_00025 [Boudabousia liubingyangii]|nr:hypothetical protein BSR28_00025 [Boudabousia liubingyangii]